MKGLSRMTKFITHNKDVAFSLCFKTKVGVKLYVFLCFSIVFIITAYNSGQLFIDLQFMI